MTSIPTSLPQKAAKEVRETFVPQLGVLRRPYADEAAAALEKRPDLLRLKNELKSLAVPGGGALTQWAQNFIQAGDAIDTLLRERAQLLNSGENAAITAPLRSTTVGLLGRYREALRDEVEEEGSALPKDHEATLFAYIDQLAAQRANQTSADAAPTTPPTESESPSAP